MPIVSIIVPVYKVEKYLHRCIVSILAQTFTDFELILVDDGSPDNCGTICDEYAGKDSRVVVIHKENGGVSSARNAGVAIAKGKYVMFCDSDDQITENALTRMVDAFDENECQMIVGGFERIRINTDDNQIQTKKELSRANIQIKLNGDSTMLQFWANNNMLSACGKLFKKDIISNNHIEFNANQIVFEDYGFVIDYLTHCSEISMIEGVVYRYFSCADSSVTERRARIDFYDDVVCVSKKLEQYLMNIGCTSIDEFLDKTIYPTMKFSYDLLWDIPCKSVREKLGKLRRIKKAMSEAHFHKMIQTYRSSYSVLAFFCLKHKLAFGVWIVRLLRNFFINLI